MGFNMRITPFCTNPFKRLNPFFRVTPNGIMDTYENERYERRRKEREKEAINRFNNCAVELKDGNK